MTDSVIVRLATTTDYAVLAKLLTVARPEYPRKAEDLHYADKHRPAHCLHTVFVAEKMGLLIGYAYYTQYPDLYHARQFHVDVFVLDDYRTRGVGYKLYDTMMQDLRSYQPEKLYTSMSETELSGFIFASKRGFMQVSERFESVLQTDNADLGDLDARLSQLAEQDIIVRSFADCRSDSDADEKLYALHSAIDADVPIDPPVTPLAYPQWRARLVDHPKFLPGGTFVAIHNDNWVGLSTLFQYVDEMAYVELTGALPEYRRKGISTALKLCGIRYAKAQQIPEVGTTNDGVNVVILNMNQRLGFIAKPARITLRLTV